MALLLFPYRDSHLFGTEQKITYPFLTYYSVVHPFLISLLPIRVPMRLMSDIDSSSAWWSSCSTLFHKDRQSWAMAIGMYGADRQVVALRYGGYGRRSRSSAEVLEHSKMSTDTNKA